jgi:hypothetical protein
MADSDLSTTARSTLLGTQPVPTSVDDGTDPPSSTSMSDIPTASLPVGPPNNPTLSNSDVPSTTDPSFPTFITNTLPTTLPDTSSSSTSPTLTPPTSPTPTPSTSQPTNDPSSSSPAPSSSVTVTPVGATSSSSSTVSAGAIAGAVIGVLALVALLAALFLCLRRRRRAAARASHVLPTRRVTHPDDHDPQAEPKPASSRFGTGASQRRGHQAQSSSLGALVSEEGGASTGTLHPATDEYYAGEKAPSSDGHSPVSALPSAGYADGAADPKRSRSTSSSVTVVTDHAYGTYPAGTLRTPRSRTSSASTPSTPTVAGSLPPASARGSARYSAQNSVASPIYGLAATYPPSPATPTYAAAPPGSAIPAPPRRSAERERRASDSRQASRESVRDSATPTGAAGPISVVRAPSAGARRAPRKKPVPRYDDDTGAGSSPPKDGFGFAVSTSAPKDGLASPTGTVSTTGPSSPPGLRGLGPATGQKEYAGMGGKEVRGVHYLIPDMPAEQR